MSRPISCVLPLILVVTVMLSSFFKLVSRPNFSYHRSSSALVLIATLSCNFVVGFCCSKQSYVATCFLCSYLDLSRDSVFLVTTVMLSCLYKLVSRPIFSFRNSNSILVLVATLSCIIVISIATQKVCHDRVLLPLSLFPCCNFIFDVAPWTFVLGMFYMSRPQYVMSRRHFSKCSIFSYHDLVFLVAT